MNYLRERWQKIAIGLELLALTALLGSSLPQREWLSPPAPLPILGEGGNSLKPLFSATALAQTAIASSSSAHLQQFQARIGNATVAVSVVELDPYQPDFKLRPFWASPAQIPGLLDTQSAAREAGAAIAINGGFFSRITHQPLGALRLNGEWVSSPILGRGVMAWNDRGEFLFSRTHFRERVTTSGGSQFELLDLNSGYFRAGFARYTAIWGRDYSTETDREVVLSVAGDRIVNRQTADLAGSLTVAIPTNGYLLVARQTESADLARQLSIGDILRIETRIEPAEIDRFPHAIGAGPLLLQSGRIVLDAELEQFRPPFGSQRAARSAVGYTASGKLLFVTAGKGEEDTGITLYEMARLMQQLDSRDALNLDGGTSSTLYAGDRIVNFSGRPPRVHNSLGWFD